MDILSREYCVRMYRGKRDANAGVVEEACSTAALSGRLSLVCTYASFTLPLN